MIPVVLLPIALLLWAMALGTASLNATARYTAREAAAQGIRRDIRRAAFHHVRRMLMNRDHVDFERLGLRLGDAFRDAWSGLTPELILQELRGAAIDLGLELSLEHEGQEIYDLRPLRQRLQELHSFSAAFEEDEFTFDFDQQDGEDEVVFDTQIQHDHVTVLGRA